MIRLSQAVDSTHLQHQMTVTLKHSGWFKSRERREPFRRVTPTAGRNPARYNQARASFDPTHDQAAKSTVSRG
jgi:hypothetical protein